MNPAPMLARTSLMGKMKSLGTPFLSGWWDRERWVFAMQMGKFPKPCKKGKEMCSLSINVRVSCTCLPCTAYDPPQLRARHRVGAFCYLLLFTAQDGTTTCTWSSSGRLRMSSIYFGELSLWEGSIMGVFGESVSIFRQSSSGSSSSKLSKSLSKAINIRDSER